MIPQIFNLGPLSINSFGLMIALALVAATFRLAHSFKINGIDPKLAERYVFTAGITGLIGARIWYIATFWNDVQDDLLGAIFSSAGFVFYGGLIIAIIVMYVRCRLDKIPFSLWMDSAGPAMALGYAVGRLGCQLSGDGDYGVSTDSFLGMSYATGVVPTPPGVLAYPTPLYESFLALTVLWILTRVETRSEWRQPYRRFGLYFLLMSVERFLIEFLRRNPEVVGALSQAQVLAIIFAAIGVILVLPRKSQPPATA